MFKLQAQPIDGAALENGLRQPSGGALVVFEGRVRSRNRERDVTHLEYEGAEALAAKEFARIETEAREQFAVLDMHCVHRTGDLAVGETAVWVGVVAAHRDAAFEACRYTIDELKRWLPIWKKEHYAQGEPDWVNAP